MTYEQLTNREFAYFCVHGTGRHEAVTELIGVKPHEAYSADDINPRTNKPFGAMTWRLNSGCNDREPLAQHVESLLLWLNRRPDAIKRLSEDHDLCLVCVGYYPGPGHGAHFSRDTIRVLGRLGIEIDMDFYFVDDHGHNAEMR
jgi:hypothetical protein